MRADHISTGPATVRSHLKRRRTLAWTRLILCLAMGGAAWSGADLRGADEPILTIESGGHTANVRWLGFTPDGRHLLSAGDDKVVRVWDLSQRPQPLLTRTLRFQIRPGQEGMIYACALSPDGEQLAVGGYPVGAGSKGHPFSIVNFHTGEVLELLKGHTNVIYALAFSPDGKWLASGSADKTVRVWGRGQRTEGRSQKSEVRGQRSEVSGRQRRHSRATRITSTASPGIPAASGSCPRATITRFGSGAGRRAASFEGRAGCTRPP